MHAGRVLTVHQVDAAADAEIWRVIDEFAGVPLSHADASLVALGRTLRVPRVFSFDSDLRTAGLELLPG